MSERKDMELIAELVPKGSRVLDLGCGVGHSFHLLAPRETVGVDLDGPTIAAARRRNLDPHARELRGRLELVQGDVLQTRRTNADVICAMNFSFCVFKQRAQLARYLKAARAGLAEKGLLFLELYGGTGATDAV